MLFRHIGSFCTNIEINSPNKFTLLSSSLQKIQNSFFYFFDNEESCCPCATVYISCKIYLLYGFGSPSSACCLFRSITINAGCIVIAITSSNLSDVFISSYVICYWMLKKASAINYNVLVFYFHG